MSPIQQMLLGVGAKDDPVYLDEIFSNYVWTGTGNETTITTGIDSSEGAMVWIKNRHTNGGNQNIFDTARGATKYLRTNSGGGEGTLSDGLTEFLSTGFKVDDSMHTNATNDSYSSLSFRKSKGFFDIQTWTHGSSADSNRRISHDLGSVPGMIWVKRTNNSSSWYMYHRKLSESQSTDPRKYYIAFDSELISNAYYGSGSNSWWGIGAPSATDFGLDETQFGWSSGDTFVAYIFAHDDQSLGEAGNASGVYCGNYTGNGSTDGPTVTLGWEPDVVMLRSASGSTQEGWMICDSMRGMHAGGGDKVLFPSSNGVEQNRADGNIYPLSTGFKIDGSNDTKLNTNGVNYVFLAIRKADGVTSKPVTDATKVFAMDYGNASSTSSIATYDSGFPVDFSIRRQPATSQSWYAGSRLTGTKSVTTDTNVAEVNDNNLTWDRNDGVGKWSGDLSSYLMWQWKRHAGFECISYIGNGTAGRQLTHHLSKTPEMIFMKNRDETANWIAWHKGLNGGTNSEKYYLRLNTNDAEIYLPDLGAATTLLFNDTAPTSTVVTLGDSGNLNKNGYNHIMMLFASVENISKVGSYTGNGNAMNSNPLTITTGFQPRFILIKLASDETHKKDWNVFDSVRGLGSGNDPRLALNSDGTGDSYDFVEVTSTGFKVNNWTDVGASGYEYIYYAHA